MRFQLHTLTRINWEFKVLELSCGHLRCMQCLSNGHDTNGQCCATCACFVVASHSHSFIAFSKWRCAAHSPLQHCVHVRDCIDRAKRGGLFQRHCIFFFSCFAVSPLSSHLLVLSVRFHLTDGLLANGHTDKRCQYPIIWVNDVFTTINEMAGSRVEN